MSELNIITISVFVYLILVVIGYKYSWKWFAGKYLKDLDSFSISLLFRLFVVLNVIAVSAVPCFVFILILCNVSGNCS